MAEQPSYGDGARVDEFPSLEDDGWELEDIVEINREAPDTFNIPSETERTNLQVGDMVKLVFLLLVQDDDDEKPYVQGERMHVEVNAVVNGRYRGVLRDAPGSSAILKMGDVITFGPEHVATIIIPVTDPRHPAFRA